MNMGKYCKAHHARSFRGFSGWKENLASLRTQRNLENGSEVEHKRTILLDDDVLYLQENHVVTDGIFKDENIVFDDVTEEWKRYCAEVLEFRIPDYASSSSDRGASS